MKYSHILFDLDGTITEPFEGITKAIQYSLLKFGITVDDRETLRAFIGPPLFESFRNIYGMTNEESVRAVEYYREYYVPTGIYECYIFEGIENMLKKLSENGLSVILATSKPEKMAKTVLTHFGLDKYFSHICGASLDESRSKKSDVIAYALECAGNPDKNDCIMVGDRCFDIEGAHINGLSALGANFGNDNRDELEKSGAVATFDSADELCEYLMK